VRTALAAAPPGPIEHITGNLYTIFGGGGNTLVLVQEDGVALVDTKMPGNAPISSVNGFPTSA
jgi:hypothetical protein